MITSNPKPKILYHGSSHKILGELKPELNNSSNNHNQIPSVFGTARKDIAALFMFPIDKLASIGFEQDIAYICIWGKHIKRNIPGYIYTLPTVNFQKRGKKYEWQSYKPVEPTNCITYNDVVYGMMWCAVQVYFINSDLIFDKIVKNKNNRKDILLTLESENERKNIHIKQFNKDINEEKTFILNYGIK